MANKLTPASDALAADRKPNTKGALWWHERAYFIPRFTKVALDAYVIVARWIEMEGYHKKTNQVSLAGYIYPSTRELAEQCGVEIVAHPEFSITHVDDRKVDQRHLAVAELFAKLSAEQRAEVLELVELADALPDYRGES